MVDFAPAFERHDRPDDPFLAHLEAPSDAGILQIGSTDQLAPPRDDAGRRRAQKLMRRIEHEIGPVRDEPPEIIFGRGVDDHRHAFGVSDLGETGQGDHAVLRGVVGDDVERRGGLRGEGGLQFVFRR